MQNDKLKKNPLKRSHPGRYKIKTLNTPDNVPALYRMPKALKSAIFKEATLLSLSESLYVNLIIENRNIADLKNKIINNDF